MKLIVGLGNPGDKYAGNRHNIGFMAIDEMARGYSFGPWKKRFQGFAAEGQIGVEKCILLKPGTYMNESGRSVGEAMRFYKLPVAGVIVVHDELDLKPGTVRVKSGGGNAGHNGLKSISAHIGNDYKRVRLGIGHPGDKALVSNYVLQDFAKADREWLEPLLEGIARGMARLVEGSEAAFLSDAARERVQAPAAPKLNGASAPEAKIEAPLPKIEAARTPEDEALAVIAAAASRPIQAMPVPSLAVVAARDGGGGGVVAKAVMLPEPQPIPVAAKPVSTAAGPETLPERAAAYVEPQPVNEAASPAPVYSLPVEEAAPEPEIESAPVPEIPVHAVEPQPQPAIVTVREEAPAAVFAAAPAPANEMAVPAFAETPAAKPHAAPAQPGPETEPKKEGGLFSRWFRSRVRGGVAQ